MDFKFRSVQFTLTLITVFLLSQISFGQETKSTESDSTKTGLFKKHPKDSTKTGLSDQKSDQKEDASKKKTKKKGIGAHTPADTTKKVISVDLNQSVIPQDTNHQEVENSPLDIGENRGLYILADKGDLQMRILGSVRFSAFYNLWNLSSENSFNTYDIPTGDDNFRLPSYYNSLVFSRFGFEVTRKTNSGDFFIRLEMDFAGTDNTFRIRHAYAKYKNFLVGQTWSLLTNVQNLPTTVDPDGPVAAVAGRTPQFRYSHKITNNVFGAYAIEYSLPDYTAPDSVDVSFVQTIPNLTARFSANYKFGSVQLAAIVAPITGYQDQQNKNTTFGYGFTLSGKFDLAHSDKLLYQGTFGNAISHFLNPFSGSGEDMAYDPNDNEFKGLNVLGGWLSYGHHWPNRVSSYFSFGIASISNRSFQTNSDYNFSYDFSVNGFWTVVEGLKVGLEVLYGERFNIDGSRGKASRVWTLFYYDF